MLFTNRSNYNNEDIICILVIDGLNIYSKVQYIVRLMFLLIMAIISSL